MDKQQRFVENCVKVLNDANEIHGYAVISKETLGLIVSKYVELYDPPTKPGTRPKYRIKYNKEAFKKDAFKTPPPSGPLVECKACRLGFPRLAMEKHGATGLCQGCSRNSNIIPFRRK